MENNANDEDEDLFDEGSEEEMDEAGSESEQASEVWWDESSSAPEGTLDVGEEIIQEYGMKFDCFIYFGAWAKKSHPYNAVTVYILTRYIQGVEKVPCILNLNNLEINSRIAKPNTYLKPRGLHNFFFFFFVFFVLFLIPIMMLELLLLDIYKLNIFSALIPQVSCFAISWQMEACFITNPNIVCKRWFLFYLVTYQITKSDSRSLSATLMFYFICIM